MKLSEKILQLDENLNKKKQKERTQSFDKKGHSENMVIDWAGLLIWPDWTPTSIV